MSRLAWKWMWAMGIVSIASGLQADTELTLMTYNIHVGIPAKNSSKTYRSEEKDMRTIADVITASQADVVGLQEVDCEFGTTLPAERRRSSAVCQPRSLSSLTTMSYAFGSTLNDANFEVGNTRYVEWGSGTKWTSNGEAHGEFGNCVLSRLPFKTPPTNLALPCRPKEEQRACLRLELQPERKLSGHGPVVVYACHLQHTSDASRVEQMKAIMAKASQESTSATVFIMGDFNAATNEEGTSGSKVLAVAFAGGFVDLAQEFAKARGGKPGLTFPAEAPDKRIDYILCNRKLAVKSSTVPESLASDHRPVVVTVDLGAKQAMAPTAVNSPEHRE